MESLILFLKLFAYFLVIAVLLILCSEARKSLLGRIRNPNRAVEKMIAKYEKENVDADS